MIDNVELQTHIQWAIINDDEPKKEPATASP